MGLYEASPVQSFGTGLVEGATATREKFREEQVEKDKQALALYTKLLESGNWDIVDPEKGSASGQVFKVGNAGILAPKAVSKYDIEKMRLEKDLEVAKIHENVQKAMLAGYLSNNEAQKETARLNQLSKADDVKIGQLRIEGAQLEKDIRTRQLLHEERRATLEFNKPAGISTLKVDITKMGPDGKPYTTDMPITMVVDNKGKPTYYVNGKETPNYIAELESQGWTVGKQVNPKSAEQLAKDEASREARAVKAEASIFGQKNKKPNERLIPGLADEYNMNTVTSDLYLQINNKQLPGKTLEKIPVPSISLTPGEPAVKVKGYQAYELAASYNIPLAQLLYNAYDSALKNARANKSASDAEQALYYMELISRSPGMESARASFNEKVRQTEIDVGQRVEVPGPPLQTPEQRTNYSKRGLGLSRMFDPNKTPPPVGAFTAGSSNTESGVQ